MTTIIRDFQPNDSTDFLNVVRELQIFELELYDRMMVPEQIEQWYIDELLNQCRDKDGSILVAVRDSHLIGYATIFTRVEQEGGAGRSSFYLRFYKSYCYLAYSKRNRSWEVVTF